MKIGYARVSTRGQDLETQKQMLTDAGCEKLYVEKKSGRNTKDRPELESMMENLREGDHVYITKIDRLARSIIDLNKIAENMREKGVSLTFIKDSMTFKPGELASMQALTFNILGAFAQFERDLIVERTGEGRATAKAQGKHMGRKGRPKKDIERALNLYSNKKETGHSISDIVKLTGVPKATLYHEIKKEGLQ